MRFYRRMLLIAVTSLFRLTLVFGISLLVIIVMFATPKPLEATLQSTGSYAKFIPAIIQSINAQNQGKSSIPFNDPGVKNVANVSFPPDTIRGSAETVINGAYNWLQGKTPQLKFTVDFTENRQLLATNLSSYAFNVLASRPLCTVQPAVVNPFTTSCLPRGFNLPAERAQFALEVNNLLPKTVFTANDLPKLSNGKPITTTFHEAPRYYHIAVKFPYIFGALMLIYIIAIIFLSSTKRRGFKLLGSLTFSSGIAIIVTPLLYEIVYPHISSSFNLQSTSVGVNVLVNNLIQAISHNFYTTLIQAAFIVISVGIILIVIERVTQSRGYSNLTSKTGLANSEKAFQGLTDTGLTRFLVPLQSSEEDQQRMPKQRRSRAYRKIRENKEL